MTKNTKRRSPAQLARDRRREAELYLQGWLQVDIGEELGIDHSTVSRDLKAIQADWLKSALIDFGEAKAREIAKIDALERTYHQAWLRSHEDAETVIKKTKGTVRKVDADDGTFFQERPAEVNRTSKGQVGDPRFLAGVQWCIERRCKIFGMDAAQTLNVQGKTEVKTEVKFDLSNIPVELLQSLAYSGSDSEPEAGSAERIGA